MNDMRVNNSEIKCEMKQRRLVKIGNVSPEITKVKID